MADHPIVVGIGVFASLLSILAYIFGPADMKIIAKGVLLGFAMLILFNMVQSVLPHLVTNEQPTSVVQDCKVLSKQNEIVEIGFPGGVSCKIANEWVDPWKSYMLYIEDKPGKTEKMMITITGDVTMEIRDINNNLLQVKSQENGHTEVEIPREGYYYIIISGKGEFNMEVYIPI